MYRLRLFGVLLAISCSTAMAQEPTTAIAEGHNLLQEKSSNANAAGSLVVGSLAFHDVTGKAYYLDEQLERGPAALVFLSTKCPLAKRYTQRLNRLYEKFSEQGVGLVGIFPNADETAEGVREYAQACEFAFPIARDIQGYVSQRVGATMTPQVFLIDQDSRLRYRGAIDDNRYENRVTEHYLVDALEQVLRGEQVALASSQALGCSIYLADADEGQGEITYSRHIARIIQDNCQGCHRDGQVAPFALTNYEEARRWQTEIKAYTLSKLMPPWKAVPGHGDFKNDISLTDHEIALIGKWVEQGAPLGNEAELPPPPKFHDGWAFGEPDLIVEMPEEYVIGPEGEDDYRHFIIPYHADAHRFVEAVDVRPGNRSVVHHVIAYVDTSGEARKLDAADPGPGYSRFGDVGFKPASMIGGWAPGNLPIRTPLGTGRWLPKDCDIVLQVHYYRTGIEERDTTRLGIYFSMAPTPVPTRLAVAINQDFTLKAGDPRCFVEAECTIKESSYLFSVTPHMHLTGETMEVSAHCPDGTVIPVIKIDDWDFNWQNSYHFRQMQLLPAGTKVKLVATFDNSADNPNNPNRPPQDLHWGEKTTDEMCLAFLGLLHQSEYDPQTGGRRVASAKLTQAN